MRLLERDSQIRSFTEYAEQARAGHGRLVLVSGEAGIGKSALVEHLADTLTDAQWWWGACDGLFTPRPLGPLFDIAADVGGELRDLCDAGAPRDRLFEAMLRRIRASTCLTVVVIEDVHWADEATLDLLRFLGRRIRGARVMIIVTYRDDALAPDGSLRVTLGGLATQATARRITLGTLSRRAVATLAAGSDVEPGELFQTTGGNPFFVIEVLTSGTGGVPASARDAILARAADLGDAARRALDCAALIGNRVDVELLGTATGADAEVVDELVRRGMFIDDHAVMRFRHELSRRAVEAAITPQRRRSLHRDILSALLGDARPDDAQVAFHAEGAGDADAVLAAAPRAGRQSAALAAHRAAVAQFERALRFAGNIDPRTRASLLDELADELALVDSWEQAADARKEALDIWRDLGDTFREGAGLRRYSSVMWRLCRGEECVDAGNRAIALLEAFGETKDLAYAYMIGADYTDPAACRRSVDRARQIAEGLGESDVLSDVLNQHGCLAYLEGGEWEPSLLRALEIALQAGSGLQVGRAYANAFESYVSEFRFAEGEAYWQDGIVYCEEHDLSTYANCLRGHRALALVDQGRWDEAWTVAQRVLSTIASPINMLTSQITCGLVAARRGRPDCMRYLEDACAAATGTAEAPWIVLARIAMAEARWLSLDISRARDDVATARAALTPLDSRLGGLVASWELRLGVPAGEYLPTDPYAGQLTGDIDTAVRRWDCLGMPYHAALALAGGEDHSCLRAALSRLDDLGATAASRVVRMRMRDLGIRSVPAGVRAATRDDPLRLTRREREVLELVAEGHTNDDIATALVISVKTVDHHVSSVLAKLGVSTRRQAAQFAGRAAG